MNPFKPMTKREISQYINNLQKVNNNLELENIDLKAKVKTLTDDSDNLKANDIITTFKGTTKAELLALSDGQRELIILRVLKALCFDALEPEV